MTMPAMPDRPIAIGIDTRCKHWCFLPGLSHLGPYGLPQCRLNKDHEGDHQLTITINGPPTGTFTITWSTQFDGRDDAQCP